MAGAGAGEALIANLQRFEESCSSDDRKGKQSRCAVQWILESLGICCIEPDQKVGEGTGYCG